MGGLRGMYRVLLLFKVNLLAESQASTFFNWLLACLYNENDLLVKNTFVSSANIMILSEVMQVGKSIRYNKNSSRPRIDPCDTPTNMRFVSEICPATSVYIA